MKRVIILTALFFSAFVALTQQPPKRPTDVDKAAMNAREAQKPTASPVLSDRFKAQFYKSQRDMERAQSAVQNAQAEIQAMAADFQKECGSLQPQVDLNGDPICGAKPPEPPAKK